MDGTVDNGGFVRWAFRWRHDFAFMLHVVGSESIGRAGGSTGRWRKSILLRFRLESTREEQEI